MVTKMQLSNFTSGKTVNIGVWTFHDAHDLTQARDDSLNCNIKRSLAARLDASKTFVLIVGNKTNTVTSGSCSSAPCDSYNSWTMSCAKGYNVDYLSYIKYECDKAVKDRLKIVVLYNSTRVNKSNCPDVVKNVGTHTAMCYYENGQYYWDYQAVKSALDL